MASRDLASGKGHRDENFPVASLLIKADCRPPIMAFYRFARAADDIADHPNATSEEKLAQLARMRRGLDGDGTAEAVALRDAMTARGIDPVHAHDLLDAFVRDVSVTRYATWDDLMGYCRLSAMPVGRFVLDVHGEDRALWPANDALCAALQIVNHLQDCGKDYRMLDRVYIPLDTGVNIADLPKDRASEALRAIIADLARRTRGLLDQSVVFSARIRDRRLAAEVAVIHRLARSLTYRLEQRDPLSQHVHHGKAETLFLAATAALPVLLRRAA
ncbi:squalene synthase HpnC [Novosphingobium sp. BL-8H]|uniref:squalene synthase HpnC n=1 Tax=Novosphingobium sp. BL-8H TaxID=3127640 RepID=UPI003756D27A